MNEEMKSIPEYLERLRAELAGSDPALVQDALYDAEEYLRNARAELAGAGLPGSDGTRGSEPESGAAAGAVGEGEAEPMRRAIERYGSPQEVAEAYRTTEVRVAAALAQPGRPRPLESARQKPPLAGVLRILTDPTAYGSLLYMFLALPTGILYFTWAVTGLSLSLGTGILIIGLPIFLLFLATVRALSLVEGRLVESLLGLRMPRRPRFVNPAEPFWQRIRSRVSDRTTWTTLLYMILSLPLGVISFALFTTLMSISLALLLAPFAEAFFGLPFITVGMWSFHLPVLMTPIVWLAGLGDLLVLLHLARGAGRLRGAMAKSMLVRAAA